MTEANHSLRWAPLYWAFSQFLTSAVLELVNPLRLQLLDASDGFWRCINLDNLAGVASSVVLIAAAWEGSLLTKGSKEEIAVNAKVRAITDETRARCRLHNGCRANLQAV